MATDAERIDDLEAALAALTDIVRVMAKAQGFRPDMRTELETTTDRVRPDGRT